MLLSKQNQLLRNFSKFSRVLCQQAIVKDVEKDKNEVFHDQHKIKFKKLQIHDKLLSQLMLSIKSKKKQEQEKQIIVEGKQLITEAVQSHFRLKYLLFSHIEKISEVLNIMGSSTEHVNFIKVPQQDLTYWSVLQTCPGLIGIFDKPPNPKVKPNALPVTIICDNIREPNNVGAVVRVANALPATKVLLPKGCSDPWDVKAIRGSSGSIFHIQTHDSLEWQQIENAETLDENSVVLIADNDTKRYHQSDVVAYDQIPSEFIAGKHIYVVIGGESHGISDEARNFAFRGNWKVVNIALDSTVNSLNTSNALAIILFEIRRRLSASQ